MGMKEQPEYFQVDGQWNVVHFPERPNGFAILIIGDVNHYVEESSSLWIQHVGKYKIIRDLTDKGYLVFYSNLFGRNWGSPKAIDFLRGLHHLIMKSYILNEKIHVIAEGMGALTAIKTIQEMEGQFRSAAFLNPCLDLKTHFESERQDKLFYKRFVRELSIAYQEEKEKVEECVIKPFTLEAYMPDIPIKIWHATDVKTYDINLHSRAYEQLRKEHGKPIALSFYLFEKQNASIEGIQHFFRENEKEL